MGQIFGNVNDPRARESGRGSLSPSPSPAAAPAPEPERPYPEEPGTALDRLDAALPPASAGVGELLRSRKAELEQRLAAADHLVRLSEKRASDLTLDELTEIWESL